MGYALAAAAMAAGADVTLITAETSLRPPHGADVGAGEHCRRNAPCGQSGHARRRRVDHGGGRRRLPARDQITAKAQEDGGSGTPRSPAGANPDILASIDRPNLLKIGFAAETDDLIENAAQKLAAKGLEMIVANDAVSTIGAADSTATILTGERTRSISLPTMSKETLAAKSSRWWPTCSTARRLRPS